MKGEVSWQEQVRAFEVIKIDLQMYGFVLGPNSNQPTGEKRYFETVGGKSEHEQSIQLGLIVVSKKICYLLGIYIVIFLFVSIFLFIICFI